MFQKNYLKTILCLILVFSLFQISTSQAIVGSTNLTKNSIDVDQWTKVEKGLEDPSNFTYGGEIPEFSMDSNGVIEFNSGHAAQGSDYEGYYWKPVDLKGDFELIYKARTYTGNTDSNLAFVSLSENKSNEVYDIYKDNPSTNNTPKTNIFYSYLNSGRSWWTSLYGPNQGGPGFPLIGSTVRGEGIDRYDYSAYDKYLGDNKYGFKHETNKAYTVKMSRKSGIFYFSITNSDNELVHEWKLEDKHNVHFKYLSVGMANADDLDTPIGSQRGKIWDIQLKTGAESITSEPEEEPEVETDNLIYKSLLPLLGVEKIAYQNFSNKVYYINTEAELKKYSRLVELAGGNIIIGKIITDSDTENNKSAKAKDVFPQRIIKKKNDPSVYYVDNNKKELKAIINPAGLKKVVDIPTNKEIDWSIVKEITSAEFDKYRDYSLGEIVGEEKVKYQNGDLIKSEKDNKVYLVEQGKKKHIKSEKVFDQMGFNWKKIKTLPELLIQSLENGEEIDLK